jgi:phosphoglycerate dehydrogenase-like enzyme
LHCVERESGRERPLSFYDLRATRIVVVADPSFGTLQLLRDAAIDFTVTTDEAALRDAEVILLAPRYGAKTMRGVAGNAPRLRWIHALAAGVETLPLDTSGSGAAVSAFNICPPYPALIL